MNSAVAGYKNQRTEIGCIPIHQQWSDRKINQGIYPIYSCTKNHKIPRNNSKEVKNLYTENYRELMKEIEEDTKIMEKDCILPERKNKYC